MALTVSSPVVSDVLALLTTFLLGRWQAGCLGCNPFLELVKSPPRLFSTWHAGLEGCRCESHISSCSHSEEQGLL